MSLGKLTWLECRAGNFWRTLSRTRSNCVASPVLKLFTLKQHHLQSSPPNPSFRCLPCIGVIFFFFLYKQPDVVQWRWQRGVGVSHAAIRRHRDYSINILLGYGRLWMDSQQPLQQMTRLKKEINKLRKTGQMTTPKGPDPHQLIRNAPGSRQQPGATGKFPTGRKTSHKNKKNLKCQNIFIYIYIYIYI